MGGWGPLLFYTEGVHHRRFYKVILAHHSRSFTQYLPEMGASKAKGTLQWGAAGGRTHRTRQSASQPLPLRKQGRTPLLLGKEAAQISDTGPLKGRLHHCPPLSVSRAKREVRRGAGLTAGDGLLAQKAQGFQQRHARGLCLCTRPPPSPAYRWAPCAGNPMQDATSGTEDGQAAQRPGDTRWPPPLTVVRWHNSENGVYAERAPRSTETKHVQYNHLSPGDGSGHVWPGACHRWPQSRPVPSDSSGAGGPLCPSLLIPSVPNQQHRAGGAVPGGTCACDNNIFR